jgi:hypothetical protein
VYYTQDTHIVDKMQHPHGTENDETAGKQNK